MERIRFDRLPEKERKYIFQEISNITGMTVFAVEKDWWVVQMLSLIFEMDFAQHLVFKGGTSLSKAWKLISRFSEDVDLAIDRNYLGFGGELSKSQRTSLRKAASAFTSGKFIETLSTSIQNKGIEGIELNLVEAKDSDQDPRIIEIHYPNIITSPGYLEPKVQLEVGCRSLKEPFSVQSFASLVDEYHPGKAFVQPHIQVPTVDPERTFLEKIFLLHEEFQRPQEKIRVNRLSRHLYDIVKLSMTPYWEKALQDNLLYELIVEHRHKYTRVSGVDYNLHRPKMINPLPPVALLNAWKEDYQTMIQEMIYEPNSPSFDEIVEQVTIIKKKINSLPWELKRKYPTIVQEK